MEIRFTYSGYTKQMMLSIFFILIGLVFLIPAFILLYLGSGSSGADQTVYFVIGSGFFFPGLGFFIFGLMRFNRIRSFYSNSIWTGIRVNGDQLKAVWFDYWKLKEITLGLNEIVSVQLNSNRGQRFLDFNMNKTKKHIAIPIQVITVAEAQDFLQKLLNELAKPSQIQYAAPPQELKRSSFLTDYHKEIAETLLLLIEEKIGVRIERNIEIINEEEVHMGENSSADPKPYLSIRNIGDGFGDTYSGTYDHQILFSLQNVQHSDGRKYLLNYSHESTNLAGSTSHFSTNMLEDEQNKFEIRFYGLLNSSH